MGFSLVLVALQWQTWRQSLLILYLHSLSKLSTRRDWLGASATPPRTLIVGSGEMLRLRLTQARARLPVVATMMQRREVWRSRNPSIPPEHADHDQADCIQMAKLNPILFLLLHFRPHFS